MIITCEGKLFLVLKSWKSPKENCRPETLYKSIYKNNTYFLTITENGHIDRFFLWANSHMGIKYESNKTEDEKAEEVGWIKQYEAI